VDPQRYLQYRSASRSNPAPLRYDTVPNLPQNQVVREKALAEMRNVVVTEGAGVNIAVPTIAGGGGIGKTVLATGLYLDRVAQRVPRWDLRGSPPGGRLHDEHARVGARLQMRGLVISGPWAEPQNGWT